MSTQYAPQGEIIEIVREFDAPRELVWKCWTEPEHLQHWWGPDGFSSPGPHIDARIGGRWLYCMRPADGNDIWCGGKFIELSPYDRILCTDDFTDQDGNPVSPSVYGLPADFPGQLMIEVTLEDLGGRTRLTMRQWGVSAPIKPGDPMLGGAGQGWSQSFDKLAAHLAAMV
jgi:uncharacterized protein YndB with AHSA1/START domain